MPKIAPRQAWLVVCDDYEAGPFRDHATAEAHVAGIVKLAVCPLQHRIELREEVAA